MTARGIDLFLIRAVPVSGVLAFLAVSFPVLVLLGGMALVVPGLILMIAPCAFLYLAVFSLGWFMLRLYRPLLGAAAGLALCTAIAFLPPFFANRSSLALVAQVQALDRAPQERIGPVSVVALLQPAYRDGQNSWQDETACDDLCLVLLYNGSARTVVARASAPPDNRREVRGARAWRIERRTLCPAAAPQVVPRWSEWAGGRDSRILFERIRERAASGECLVEAPLATPDLSIVRTRESLGPDVGPGLTLAPDGARADVLTIFARDGRGGARPLFRQARVRSRLIGAPLAIAPYGGWDMKWGVARSEEAPGGFDPVAILRSHTGFNLALPAGQDPVILRARIEAALSDPTVPPNAPIFELSQDILRRIAEQGAGEGDVALVARLIADPRVDTLFELPRAVHRLGPAAWPLRDPLFARLILSARLNQRDSALSADGAISLLPPGALRDTPPALLAFLRDSPRRAFAGRTISRLADAGPGALPLLLLIIEGEIGGGDPTVGSTGDRKGAIIAICRLGAAAAPALPRLLALDQAGRLAFIGRDRVWPVTLLRLGYPLERIARPADTTGDFHGHISRRAREGRCDA